MGGNILLAGIFNSILAAIRNLLAKLFTVLQKILFFVVSWAWAKFQGFLALLGIPPMALPEDWFHNSGLMPYIAAANAWIPLYETVLALSVYTALYVLIVPLKMVLRRIPFVGGG